MNLLLECHITFSVENAEFCTAVAAANHWKTSEIARDPVLGDKNFFYLTTHDTDLIKLMQRIHRIRFFAEESNVQILREKIELIIYDTKSH